MPLEYLFSFLCKAGLINRHTSQIMYGEDRTNPRTKLDFI